MPGADLFSYRYQFKRCAFVFSVEQCEVFVILFYSFVTIDFVTMWTVSESPYLFLLPWLRLFLGCYPCWRLTTNTNTASNTPSASGTTGRASRPGSCRRESRAEAAAGRSILRGRGLRSTRVGRVPRSIPRSLRRLSVPQWDRHAASRRYVYWRVFSSSPGGRDILSGDISTI